ncbi:MAG: glycosyltransferase family 87 protein [Bdellovibrionota bacterium]
MIFIFLSLIIYHTFDWVYHKFYNDNKIEMANGGTKGGDYLAFYTGGVLYKTNKKELYNLDIQKNIQDNILQKGNNSKENIKENNKKNNIKNSKEENSQKENSKEENCQEENSQRVKLPYIYPPIVAYIFSYLANFSFLNSLYFYLAFIIIFTLLVIFIFQKLVIKQISSSPNTFTTLLLLLGYIPFIMNCVFGGQLAYFGLTICVLAFYAIYKRNDFLLGIVLSLAYYKPPLFLLFVIYALIRKGKKFFLGFSLGCVLLIFITLLLIGHASFIDYFSLASGYTYGQKFGNKISLPVAQGAGVFGLLATIISGKYALYSYPIFIFITILFAYKNKTSNCIKKEYINNNINNDMILELFEYSIIFILSVGASLQCIRYDLTILFPSFLILLSLNKYIKNDIKYILYFGIALFYIEFMFREIHIFNLTINLSSCIFFIFLIPFIFTKKKECNAK